MKFLIDECLHTSLVEVAHQAGFDASHVNFLGLTGLTDWRLVKRALQDDFRTTILSSRTTGSISWDCLRGRNCMPA